MYSCRSRGCTHKLGGGAGVLICMTPESIHLPGMKPIPLKEGLASEKVSRLTGAAHTRKTNLGASVRVTLDDDKQLGKGKVISA